MVNKSAQEVAASLNSEVLVAALKLRAEETGKQLIILLEAQEAIAKDIELYTKLNTQLEEMVKLLEQGDPGLLAILKQPIMGVGFVVEDAMNRLARTIAKPEPSIKVETTKHPRRTKVVHKAKAQRNPERPYLRPNSNRADNVKIAHEIVEPWLRELGRPVTIKEIAAMLEEKLPYLNGAWKSYTKGAANIVSLMNLNEHGHANRKQFSI